MLHLVQTRHLKVSLINVYAFCYVMLCYLVSGSWHFKGSQCLHFHGLIISDNEIFLGGQQHPLLHLQKHHEDGDGVSSWNILTWLSARDNYIDFCHCKSFKTSITDGLLFKMKATQSIKMSGSTHPMTKCHIWEELYPQPYCWKEPPIS